MKKDLFTFFCVFIFSLGAFSQKEKIAQLERFDLKKIHYGYYLGLHHKGYYFNGSNVSVSSGGGFQLGVLADLHFNKYISAIAEPGVISSTNKLKLDTTKIDLPTTYFRLPISLKFTTKRINNTRAYIMSGISYNYNFSANRNKGDGGAKPNDFVLTRHNAMAEITLGANFYFPFFKFSPSIRTIFGLNNEFKGLGANAKSSLYNLRSRALLVTLTFQ